jgi:formylglycine-generating enzyme required for sulfatase activity/serine/threonine protein kinase
MTEQSIFLAALEIADVAERTAYVDRACSGDAALRQQVEALLAAHERPGEFLDVPAVEQMAAAAAQPDKGIVTVDADGKGEEVVAARAGPHDPDETQGERHGDGEENALDFLQASTKPGSLGRLGHYEVLEVLGKGGFGIVLKAFDELLHRVVAIKVMAPQLASTSSARKRFLREARAAAAIRHDNVVAIYAVEEQPIPYLVMEYVAGETLQQKLDRVGPLEVPEVLRLGQQIAAGLAAAHALGLVHRDVKPSNILLENGIERVKISDFGLARAADDASLTQTGFIAGTPLYMAPEQAQGEAMDQRADLFSLGSVLYMMCSGRPPFRASTALAVLKRVAEDTPRPIREIIPEVPEWLCALVARLHAKKPADRFASAKEVAGLLGRCLSELHQHGSVRAPAVSEVVRPARPTAKDSPESGSVAAPSSGKQRPRRLIPLAGRTAVLAVVILVGFLVVQAFQPPHNVPPTDPRAPVVLRALANQVWQDTGVDVAEGEAVVLSPQGTWRKGGQICSAAGLEGAPRERAVLPEPPLLCLLVRIGDEPAPTPVAKRDIFKPRRSGRLFVQANDLDLESNEGGLQLTITGGLRLGDAAPPPELLPIQAADQDWKPLLAKVEAPGAKPEQVRDEVFDYCQKYAGTPHAFRCGQRLRKLPPLVNSIGMKLAPIPPGKFLMGSPDNEAGRHAREGPQHEVVLTRPFYLGVYPVTKGQFAAFVEAEKYHTEPETDGKGGWGYNAATLQFELGPNYTWRNPGFTQTDDHPVVDVTWNDAQKFCAWLSRKEGKTYRLPTEAEWEYACRAGTTTRFWCGDADASLNGNENIADASLAVKLDAGLAKRWHFDETAWDDGYPFTSPVGKVNPNPWGLYDMSGNVYQWCSDRYGAYRGGAVTDPKGADSGDRRVGRGGSWGRTAMECRSAQRFYCPPSSCDSIRGFRVVFSP